MLKIISRCFDRWASPTALVLVATSLQLLLFFPGIMRPDSLGQLEQVRLHHYTDWHPPIMTSLWSWLIAVTGQVGSLWVFHQLLYGLGLALLVDGCNRAGMRRRAWMLVLVSCFPLFIFLNRFLLKDIGMTAALVAAVGLQFWFYIQNRRAPWWAIVMSCACLAYGTLLRINAVFALGPLLLLWWPSAQRFRLLKVISISIVLSGTAIFVSDVVNHRILGAEREDVMQQLQIYDLMGIEVHSKDEKVWGARYSISVEEATQCYSSFFWDTFSPWGKCAWIRPKIGHEGVRNRPEVIAERSVLWIRAIRSHPLEYLAHRVSHFNSSIYFIVPTLHYRYTLPPGEMTTTTLSDAGTTGKKLKLIYHKANFLMWPVTWIVFGACSLFILGCSATGTVIATFSRALIVSGLLYSLAYFVIGVATDVRYHYWAIIAIFTGIVLSIDQISAGFSGKTFRGKIACGLMLSVIVIGCYARFVDILMP